MTIIPPMTLSKSGLVLITATLVLSLGFPILGMFIGHGLDALGLTGLAVVPTPLGDGAIPSCARCTGRKT